MTNSRVELWWLPVGAGGHVVVHTSRWWELVRAVRERRPPRPLFHAALEVLIDDARHLIEMTPAWGATTPAIDRGVVATGPVGVGWFGRSRFFRYEVRCWADGVLADRAWAVDSPVSFSITGDEARSLLSRVRAVPQYTWGRDALGCGDMWNSNSLVAWLLQTTGINATQVKPPGEGCAPGWTAGIAASRLLAPGVNSRHRPSPTVPAQRDVGSYTSPTDPRGGG